MSVTECLSGVCITCDVHCPVSSTFTCTLKFIVKDCDPNTGEPDDEGYEDEYVVSLLFNFITLLFSLNRFCFYCLWSFNAVRLHVLITSPKFPKSTSLAFMLSDCHKIFQLNKSGEWY